MASLALFIDTTSNSFIAGLNAPSSINPASLPFYFGDTLSLKIYLMNTTGTTLSGSNPFTIIPTAGIQLFAYLDDGLIAGTIYTQQISWATDANNQYFFSTLALNTAALQTLLGALTSKQAWLKIGYVQNGLQTTVISQLVNIGVGLPTTALVVPAGLTPLSQEVAVTEFVPQLGLPGQAFYLVTPMGKKLMIMATDNPDGSAVLSTPQVN